MFVDVFVCRCMCLLVYAFVVCLFVGICVRCLFVCWYDCVLVWLVIVLLVCWFTCLLFLFVRWRVCAFARLCALFLCLVSLLLLIQVLVYVFCVVRLMSIICYWFACMFCCLSCYGFVGLFVY